MTFGPPAAPIHHAGWTPGGKRWWDLLTKLAWATSVASGSNDDDDAEEGGETADRTIYRHKRRNNNNNII